MINSDQVIPELYEAETGNSIPQQSINNKAIEKYLKFIDEFYVIGTEEDQEHSSQTNPTGVCFEIDDNLLGDDYIKDNAVSSADLKMMSRMLETISKRRLSTHVYESF